MALRVKEGKADQGYLVEQLLDVIGNLILADLTDGADKSADLETLAELDTQLTPEGREMLSDEDAENLNHFLGELK